MKTMNIKNWMGRVLACGLLLASAGAYAQTGCVMISHVPRNGASTGCKVPSCSTRCQPRADGSIPVSVWRRLD